MSITQGLGCWAGDRAAARGGWSLRGVAWAWLPGSGQCLLAGGEMAASQEGG